MVTLAALTFCCLIDIGSDATNGTKSVLNPRNATGPIYAERPLVCSSAELALTTILRKLTQILSWCASAAVKDFSGMLCETD